MNIIFFYSCICISKQIFLTLNWTVPNSVILIFSGGARLEICAIDEIKELDKNQVPSSEEKQANNIVDFRTTLSQQATGERKNHKVDADVWSKWSIARFKDE